MKDDARENAMRQLHRDREMRILIGCERCGRRISHIEVEDGELVTSTVSSMAIIPDGNGIDESARMFVCEPCHGVWLMDRLFRSGEE